MAADEVSPRAYAPILSSGTVICYKFFLSNFIHYRDHSFWFSYFKVGHPFSSFSANSLEDAVLVCRRIMWDHLGQYLVPYLGNNIIRLAIEQPD